MLIGHVPEGRSMFVFWTDIFNLYICPKFDVMVVTMVLKLHLLPWKEVDLMVSVSELQKSPS